MRLNDNDVCEVGGNRLLSIGRSSGIRIIILATLVVFSSFCCQSAEAVARFWIDSAGGAFSDPFNWSPVPGGPAGATPPGVGDTAIFQESATYLVAFGGDVSNFQAQFNTGVVIFDLNGNVYDTNLITVRTRLRVGDGGVDTDRLVLISGTLSVLQGGFVRVAIDPFWQNLSSTISSGSELVVNGGNVEFFNEFDLNGNGTLSIQNGGLFVKSNISTDIVVATTVGSFNQITVSDPGSELRFEGGKLNLGVLGTAELTVTNGGLVNGGIIDVGNAGNGTLTVSDSGTVTATGTTTIGALGTLNVDAGTLSTTSLTDTAGGTLNLNDGILEINGGTFDIGGANYAYQGAVAGQTSTLRLTNGANGTVDSMQVGQLGNLGTGGFELLGGSTFTSGLVRIARNGGSEGSATVDGNGSVWTASNMRIGENGLGSLAVQNGGTVNASGSVVNVSLGTNGDGSLLVTGNGSSFNTATLIIGTGGGGTGAVTAAAGGLVEMGGTTTLWGTGTLSVQGGTFRTGHSGQTLCRCAFFQNRRARQIASIQIAIAAHKNTP